MCVVSICLCSTDDANAEYLSIHPSIHLITCSLSNRSAHSALQAGVHMSRMRALNTIKGSYVCPTIAHRLHLSILADGLGDQNLCFQYTDSLPVQKVMLPVHRVLPSTKSYVSSTQTLAQYKKLCSSTQILAQYKKLCFQYTDSCLINSRIWLDRRIASGGGGAFEHTPKATNWPRAARATRATRGNGQHGATRVAACPPEPDTIL